jgi:hypothetical protein
MREENILKQGRQSLEKSEGSISSEQKPERKTG